VNAFLGPTGLSGLQLGMQGHQMLVTTGFIQADNSFSLYYCVVE
jgi:hypothetical protein